MIQMRYLLVKQRVSDFDKWMDFFVENGAHALPSGGLDLLNVFRDEDDPNTALLFCKVNDFDKAKAFTEQALAQGPANSSSECAVLETPEVHFLSSQPLSEIA